MKGRLKNSKDARDVPEMVTPVDNISEQVVTDLIDDVVGTAVKRVETKGVEVVKETFDDSVFEDIIRRYKALMGDVPSVRGGNDFLEINHIDELDAMLGLSPTPPSEKTIAAVIVHKASGVVRTSPDFVKFFTTVFGRNYRVAALKL
jgi:hypothetical protein